MDSKATQKDEKQKAIVVKIELSQKERQNEELRKGRLTEYTVPANEQDDTFHVELEKPSFDASMNKVSKPFVQKFDKRAWMQFREHARSIGFSHVRLLFAPKGTSEDLLTIPEKFDNQK